MDPVSAFGTTVGALQMLEYSIKIFRTALKLLRSPDTMPAEIREMETEAQDLIESIKRIPANHAQEQNQTIVNLSSDVATQLLAAANAVKSNAAGSKWKVITRTVRTIREENKTKEIQARLSELRLQLSTRFAIESKLQQGRMQATLDTVAERITSVEKKLDSMMCVESGNACIDGTTPSANESSETTCYIKVSACTSETSSPFKSAEATTELPPEVLKTFPISSDRVDPTHNQQSIIIRTPPRFWCGEARCPCSCHLGRYVKSPLFLKAFLGALSFRGTCSNHASNLWELKYWIPEWISNYNVYLLFERSASGKPSLGFRFPRKVPWGGQDTIIRFSLIGDAGGIKSILNSGKGFLDDVDPNHGRTALHTKTCRLLLEAGADRFIEDESNMSATQKAWEHIFTKRGTPAVLEEFKILFPNDDLDYWNFSPLHKAVLGIGSITPSQVIGSKTLPEVHIDAADSGQRTALHWAALRGDVEAVGLLLEADADVHAVDEFNCTPLTYAVSAAVPRIVELLILSGANVNHINKRGDSPLHYAARHKDDVDTVRTLVRAGAQVDRRNSLGNTPFAGAAIANRTAAGKYLLSVGVDRYSANKYGDTPLRETVHHNCHEFLLLLLKDGTGYSDINIHGSSLLHAVALEGDIETIRILKAASLSGLDCELKNVNGETAMDFCRKRMGAPEGFQEAFLDLLSTIAILP